MVAVELDPGTILFLTALATAVAGTVVAALAYRGYQRHRSQTMRYLAVGIAWITVGPFVVSYGLGPVTGLSDASLLLGNLTVTIVGLLAIIHSLEGV